MNRGSIFCLVSLASFCLFGSPVRAAETPVIVPQPVRVEAVAGDAGFSLGSPVSLTAVVSTDQRGEVKGIAERFARWLRPVAGVPVKVSTADTLPTKAAIVLTTLGAPDTLGDEGYTLASGAGGIVIRARQPAGLFYGLQTLRQLFPVTAESGRRVPDGFALPAVSVTDQPRFPVRSVMLDSARHLQSIGFLKKTIDEMAYHKLNRFHWHLSDDQGWRLEIKKYPKLTTVGAWRTEAGGRRYGGFYTQKQVRDLVAYARERYVTIQPEIDMPAHIQSALAAYPEIACFPKPFIVSTAGVSANGVGSPDVLCPSKEVAFRFVSDVLTEVMALFPWREIHIGGDECSKVRWRACPVCQARIKEKGLKDENALQNEFTQRIAAFLETHGRRLQGWNEIEEGGPLPKSVVVQLWNNPRTLLRSATAGRDIVYSYTAYLYLDYNPASQTTERVYAVNPLPDDAAPLVREHLLGMEACLWTERRDGDATTDDYLWPRVAALAEACWTPPALRNWPDFRHRLLTTHLDRLARFSVGAEASETQITARRETLFENGELAVGATAGAWDPKIAADIANSHDWEITKLLTGSGLWCVQSRYTTGAHGIAIGEIALVRRDASGAETIIAKDTHEGWAGSAPQNPKYFLTVPALDPSARYFLRLRLSRHPDNGTDSHGTILLFSPQP